MKLKEIREEHRKEGKKGQFWTKLARCDDFYKKVLRKLR